MNWNRLKNYKCPKCNSNLGGNARFHKCSSSKCDFMCSVQKFNKIVSDMHKPKQRRCSFEDNLSELNNMENGK